MLHTVLFCPVGHSDNQPTITIDHNTSIDITKQRTHSGECKSWTLDSGLDHGLDYGLEYGLNSRLIFKLLAMVTSQDLD